MNRLSLRTLPALILMAFSGAASAAAFQLWEQNASGLGTAYAGSAAVADKITHNFVSEDIYDYPKAADGLDGIVFANKCLESHNLGCVRISI